MTAFSINSNAQRVGVGEAVSGTNAHLARGKVVEYMKAMATSGLGKRVNNPSLIMAGAPEMVSSAGWPINMSVPCHVSLLCTMIAAVPSRDAMWMSCPQACMTETSRPESSLV